MTTISGEKVGSGARLWLPSIDGLYSLDFLNTFRANTSLVAEVVGDTTTFHYEDQPGDVVLLLDQAAFAPGVHVFTVSDGGTALPTGSPFGDDPVTGFTQIFSRGSTAETVALGIVGLTVDGLVSILTDTTDAIPRFLALFDDDTDALGTDEGDWFGVGAGNDTVDGGDGDDAVIKSNAGDLVYDGGEGFDTLAFALDGVAELGQPQLLGLAVNLRLGTGNNPFGGVLTLNSVESVADTPDTDTIIGSNRAERVVSPWGLGGDRFLLRGGDDAFEIAGTLANSVIDGGAGLDALKLSGIASGTYVLDLADPSQNTGIFAGAIIRDVELFDFWFASGASVSMAITGTGESERLNAYINSSHGVRLNIDMGEGDDTVLGSLGADVLKGGPGNDFVNSGNSTFSFGRDTLFGGDGDDRIFGTSDDALLYGGAGRDGLFSGEGDDTMYGGDGDDRLDDRFGDNLFFGGDGADEVFGGYDEDTLYGGAGADTMFGGFGIDRLFGGAGDDRISVGKNTYISRDRNPAAPDFARGGEGDDWIFGDLQPNRMFGDDGDDTIIGGWADTMTGGAGADIFRINSWGSSKFARITDFEPGIDKLDYRADSRIEGLEDLNLAESGSRVVVRGHSTPVVLVGVALADLSIDDFLF